MKEQMKRLISLILAVVMLFGMMPMNAFATEADAPEQNGLPLDSVVWELGTIASADGQNNASTSRLRTASYLNLSEYAGVGIGRGYTMTNFVYDAEYNYLGTSSWIGNGMSFTTEALQEKYPNGVYFRVALRALDQRTLSTADIPAIGVAFYAPGETIPQPESNLKYTDVGTVGSWQDGAVYDGKLFVFGGAGTGAVYDLDSLEKLGTVTLDKKDILKPHANSVCFGSTYYAEGDQYPLLYVNIYNNYATAEDRMEGTCCVYRVTESDAVFSTDLVQVIRIGFTEDLTLWKSRENNGDVRPYGNFVVDTDRDKLYAFVMRDAEKTTRFFGFDLPDLTEGTSDDVYGCNVVTLQSTDIETQFDTVYFNYLQGCCYYDGQIVSVEGFHSGGSAEPCLRIVNLDREEVTGTFYPAEAGLNSEPEVVCVDHNRGTLYYAAADGTLRIVTLENVHLHTYESVVTAPTCTEQGYTTYTCECGESYVDDYVDATGHNYENGSCTGCGEKESLQLVDGFDVVSSIRAGDSRLVDAFNTVSPLIYQDLTLFENCAITSLNLFVTGTVVDNDGTNKNDPAIDDSTEYTFDISVIDASSVKAGGYYSIKETYTLRVPGSEIKKNDWNTFDVSQLGITVDEGETLGFGSSASTLEIFYLNKCASTSLRYFGHKTTTGNTSLSLRTNYNLLVGVEGYSLVEKDTTPEEDHAHSFINGVCTVCGLSKKPYQRLTYFSVDVADENGNTYTDNAVLYLPTNYSPNGEPVKLILYCKQGGSTITSSSNPIEAVGFYNYLISLGYAVLGVDGVPDAWRDKLVLDETRVVGNPLAVQGTEAAYDYVIDNYNIAADGCFISGYSQGGHYAQNVIDLTDIPIVAAAEQSPVCSIRYHQWDLSSPKTIGGVSVTRPARLNVARIYGFPGFTTNAELLDLAYDNTLVEEYDPWVRNSQNVYTGFVQKSNLWYLPEGTSLDGITMTHAAKCPVKIWCAEDDTAISADVMKVFVKAIQNAGGTAEISVVPTGGHGFFQKQTAVGSFTENGKSYKTLPIAVEIAQWFERYGGYACKHTYSDGTCTSCGETLDLAGKTISILGASISTYAGTSNGAAADTTNSTIRGNAKYYPNSVVKDVTLNDTWWMQAAEDLGLRLLVNNSWSGSALLHERNGTVGAYVDRCVQLHDDTGDNAGEVPDIIGIQMGTNDFQYYKDTLGTADIDYAALIKANGDGSYSYSTPVTSLEAAAIVLHKISVRYPDAEVYYLNISQRVDGTDELIRSFNAELKQVVEHFGAHIVDIYGSAITMEKFDTYIGDGKVHPNRLGMDAYTEAFKKALLANTSYSVSTHVVSFDLTNAAADYGTDKTVVVGDAFRVGLTALTGQDLSVTVTMGGEDITSAVYQNGTVSIGAVTGDVVIRAVGAERTPRDYRWEFDGTDLVCVSGDNTLTKNAGTTTDGVFSQTRYGLETAVYLRHDKPWAVQWKCEGTFMNTGGSTGARIFTSTDVNAQYDARYIFKSNTNGIVAMGEKTTSGSHNYGIALAEYGIDWTQLHTYRLENRIAEDGSNMIWLFVDGVEIGPMNHYYVGTRDQNTTSDWLSGKDFTFPYMGTDTHGFSNAAIEYIAVWEAGHTHSYESAVTAPTCTEAGFTTYTCQCGESYVADYVDATGHNYENGTCIGCGATASPYLQQLPEDIVGCTNLYDSLVPVKGYYTATKYDTSNGAVISVVIPVEPGDRIAASSFGAVSENMGSVNGIRVTYLLGDKIVTSLSAGEVYNGYTSTGYITVPDGVDTASIPWWVPSDSNWLTLSQISKDFAVHSPKPVSAQAPTCTEKGYTAGEICEVCNASLGEREEIPPTGHTYSEDACTVCGAVNLRAILDGKYVSILGDSISTFNGYSNDATVNTTIGGNGPRYDAGTADTKPGSYCLLESVDQTWWMHFANRSGMKLLVNNSWAGSQVFGGQTSDGRVIPAAYLDRCVNLHDNTLEDNPGNAAVCPDVIFVYLGINDYNFNRGKVGTGAVDYAGLVSSDGTYATPATFGEAYGIMLHKMRNAYPDAQIFAMTLLPENLYSVNKAAWEQHNSYIRAAAEYYDIPVVDLAKNCAITWENYSGYMIDKIHPTTAGMELISDCIEAELVSYYKENPPHTHSYVSVVTAPTCTEAGFTTYTCQCGESYVDDYVEAIGHSYSDRCDELCNLCNSARMIYHDIHKLWSADTENHWHSCTCCRTAFGTEKHTFIDGICSVCSYEEWFGREMIQSFDELEFERIEIYNSDFNKDGWFDEKTGEPVNKINHKYSEEYYDISGTDKLFLGYTNSVSTSARCPIVFFYDENYNYISSDNFNFDVNTDNMQFVQGYYGNIIKVPENAKYARFATSKTTTHLVHYYKVSGDYVWKDNQFSINALRDKKVVFFGDSIIGNYSEVDNSAASVTQLLKELSGAETINAAFGGTWLSQRETSPYGAFSMVELVESVCTGDYSEQYANLADVPHKNTRIHLSNLCNANWEEIDYIIIEQGTNDFASGVLIENSNDRYAKNTIKGALRFIIKTLNEKYPHIEIVLCTVNPRFKKVDNGDGTYSYTEFGANRNGENLEDYANAFNSIAEEYDLVCVDLYTGSFSEENADTYFNSGDGVHPNLPGRWKIAEKIIEELGHNYELTITPPNCTEEGYTAHTCSVCGESYVADFVDALGHSYEGGICTACGEADPNYHLPGDITGDGEVNNKDLTRLFRYLSNYDVEIIDAALDVNGDGEINNKDLTRLFRYLSGHDVTIY